MKPRLTRAVRSGWNEHLRPLLTCILESGQESCFECRADDCRADDCRCEGCLATASAWAAVAWIDARL